MVDTKNPPVSAETEAEDEPTERKWTKVETAFVKIGPVNPKEPEQRPEVEGTLSDKGTQTFKRADGPETVVGRYKLTTDEGVVLTVLGSKKIDDLLASVPVGTYIRLVYTREIRTPRGKMKDVDLYIA